MDEHLLKTLEQAKRKLNEQEAAVKATKKFINQVCEFGGQPALYPDVDAESGSVGIQAMTRDVFYGKSVTTAVREYLEMRKASGLGTATHGEIIDALSAGAFDFSTISADETDAKRGVAITLAKNSSIFHKLPNGNWGLLSWFPEAKEKKQKKADPKANEPAGAKDDKGTSQAEPNVDPVVKEIFSDSKS